MSKHNGNKIERRFETAIQPEIRQRNGKPLIRGYAAVYGVEANIGNVFREKIAPGAFRRAISERQDVRALFNHDPNFILGRTSAGTLQLSEDAKGLVYEIDPPDTSVGRDLLESLRRGDVNQSSFAFSCRMDKWIDAAQGGKKLPLRIIEDVDLLDVSPVCYPAYESTSVSVRAMFPDGLPARFADTPERAQTSSTETARRRARLAEIQREIKDAGKTRRLVRLAQLQLELLSMQEPRPALKTRSWRPELLKRRARLAEIS